MKTNLKKVNIIVDLAKLLITIAIALVCVTVLILLVSDEPANAIRAFFLGPFSTTRRFSQVFQLATPIIFTGLAVTMMLRAGLFNMGSEGALYFGGICATFVAVNLELPPVLHTVVALLAAAIGGGLVGIIPAVLKAKFKIGELVVSIMMNYVMISISMFILNYYLRDISVSARISKSFPEYVKIPKIFGTAHYGFLIAVVVALIVWVLMNRTKVGYEIRVAGNNSSFASYSGIKTMKVIILSQVIGCAIAGLGGGAEVLGSYNAFSWDGATGYGFDGMVVAIIARQNPLSAVVAGLFIGYLRAGADIMNRTSDVALEVIQVVQAIMIVLVAAEAFLANWRHKLTVRQTSKANGGLTHGSDI